jgi:hypothetical protein
MENNGRITQRCIYCDYESGTITNGRPTEMSSGLKMHFSKSKCGIK